ncbi:MAG: hypothetical protein D4R64_01810 [Porphyromonadaceae bacterium]|nr:MAG: hypothetical protein D4R64_01810 [Porphyromonadaceae bacterium]
MKHLQKIKNALGIGMVETFHGPQYSLDDYTPFWISNPHYYHECKKLHSVRENQNLSSPRQVLTRVLTEPAAGSRKYLERQIFQRE